MNNFKDQKGGVVIINTLFFLTISVILVFGIAHPVTTTYLASRSFIESKKAFLVANSAAEEALYRLKSSKNLSSSEVLELASGTATIGVGEGMGFKTVNIESESNDFRRRLLINIEQGVGVSFNYGLQAGKGGFMMSGGAGIIGNVYSNGNIIGSGAPFITGSATVANQSDPEFDQSNSGPLTPPHNLLFGKNDTPQDAAQSFQVSTDTPLTAVRFYIRRSTNEWMNNVTLRLVPDDNGNPGRNNQVLATGNIAHGQVTTSYNYLTVPFSANPVLVPGETYWIVFDTGTSWAGYYSLGATHNTYGNGTAKVGQWNNQGGNWNDTNPAGLDIYFDIIVGGETGLIDGVIIGQDGGDAWAHQVNNSRMHGNLYCQGGTGNINNFWVNIACDTSRPDPVQQPFPISEANIEEWKSIAEAGGTIIGNQNYGGADFDSFGPIKIEGDLNIGAGSTVEITGTTWVTGNINISGGAELRLASNYGNGSGILVTDGRISMTGGGTMEGNGNPNSYILAVTTSTCPDGPTCGNNNPAINVTGGTGSVILNAQSGTVNFSGGASAKQVTADTVVMGGGTIVTYEEGIADVNFSSGPAGSWNLISWQEIE